ncbi:hypothetical protein GF376_04455 [Candidatus Peregrinibacteria bacterium]|nr:hypothetical protein [Candidatus Peregrinibacteria bacterium]
MKKTLFTNRLVFDHTGAETPEQVVERIEEQSKSAENPKSRAEYKQETKSKSADMRADMRKGIESGSEQPQESSEQTEKTDTAPEVDSSKPDKPQSSPQTPSSQPAQTTEKSEQQNEKPETEEKKEESIGDIFKKIMDDIKNGEFSFDKLLGYLGLNGIFGSSAEKAFKALKENAPDLNISKVDLNGNSYSTIFGVSDSLTTDQFVGGLIKLEGKILEPNSSSLEKLTVGDIVVVKNNQEGDNQPKTKSLAIITEIDSQKGPKIKVFAGGSATPVFLSEFREKDNLLGFIKMPATYKTKMQAIKEEK